MRKRIGALILAGAIATSSIVGWAEETTEAESSVVDIDLSSYTLDQLVGLRNDINELIDEGLGETDNIGTGYYVAGDDIRVGSYEIFPARESVSITIFLKLQDYNNRTFYPDLANLSFTLDYEEGADKSSTISLKEGNVLEIHGDAVIKTVKPSWAP